MKKRHKETRGATTGRARAVQSKEEKTIPFSRLACEADRELRVVYCMSGPNRPFALTYATLQDRNGGDIPAFHSELVYMGPSERIASWHFARACRAQMHDPLAYSVTLKRSHEVIAQVKPL